jgi:hypothetical protein
MAAQRIASIGIALTILVASATPIAAAQQRKRPRAECVKLTQQIARYNRDAKWADERDDELWEASSLAQMNRLSTRREKLCPEYRRSNPFAGVGRLFDAATRAATRYFLGGI